MGSAANAAHLEPWNKGKIVGNKVRDICHGDQVASRAIVMQHKTQRPVQFEITPGAREAVQKWIKLAALKSEDFLFPTAYMTHHTWARGSMRGFLKAGLKNSGSTPPITGRARCAGPRQR